MADGYEICTCKGKYGVFEMYSDLTETSYTSYYLSDETTYGVRLRAYKKKNGKTIYGPFSEIKYITTL